ncbi:phospholipase A and acyltransferase 4 [Artibeus jamaicensis]|uniref:phospholipase A and acyltransferase 4 n=1 Tax=Artibeus jamaicensis TaxID=9417 RepID=UPI00235A98A0|nr:phospholipase A and acyltransferase 4 [Artibeus jamaicensis]
MNKDENSGEPSRVSTGCWVLAWNEGKGKLTPGLTAGVLGANGCSTHSQQLSSERSPGDLIEIFRSGFQHWALYVGGGYVVHLAPPALIYPDRVVTTSEWMETSECNPRSGRHFGRLGAESPAAAPGGKYLGVSVCSVGSILCKTAEVKRELLTDVVGSCEYRVNNLLDEEMKPLPVREILSSAQRMIGKKIEYNITSKNCEHFVTKLRYGEPRCLQVEKAVMEAGLVGALGPAAALAYSVMKNWSPNQ